MIFNIICQLTLAAMCDVANGQGGDKLTDLYLIGLFPKNGSWQGGRGLQPAAEMAVEDINKRNDILPEFKLIMESRDTECSRGLGMKALADTIGGTKKTIMIIGGGCSTVSQAVAQTAHFWNLVQISYASVSPALSNRKRFPNFFRLVVSESVLNEARMALIEHYNWKRVAILYEDHQIFSKMAEDLVKGLKSKKLNIIKSSFFTDDPETALQELKEADARIIIGGFYPDKARRVFCTAYNIGFYGKQVWLTTGALSYDSRWWKERDPKINCTEFEMERVVQDVLVVHNIYTNTNDTEEGLTRLSVQKFKKIYTNKTSNMKQPLSGADRAAVGYDTVWAASIALNKTMNNLTETGRGKTLANFSYVDDEMANLIKANLRQVRFTSVSGRVAFKENGDGIRLVGIDLIRGGNVSLVGIYDKSKPEGEKLEIPHRIWKGNIPSDAMEVKKVPHVLSISTYACMTSIAGFGIILALIFLFFNIVNRNVKIIKMSSPNINNIILFGCILAYLSVFIEDVNNTVDSIYCKVKPVLLLLAFSLSFGALFAKTWRIHAVFTAGLRLKKRSIKDSTLCLMVLVLVCLNCLILIVWFSADPLTISSTDASEEEKIEDDMRIQYVHNHCWSSKQNIFLIAILVIQGIFLLLGVFLAWETRKVKLSILNESRYIGMCIYNVMTLGIIGVLVSYSLNSHPSTVYVIISCITILSSTVTQCLLFVPKIKMYRDFVKGKLKDMSTINTSDQCVPLRPGRVTVATQTDVVVTNGLELTE